MEEVIDVVRIHRDQETNRTQNGQSSLDGSIAEIAGFCIPRADLEHDTALDDHTDGEYHPGGPIGVPLSGDGITQIAKRMVPEQERFSKKARC